MQPNVKQRHKLIENVSAALAQLPIEKSAASAVSKAQSVLSKAQSHATDVFTIKWLRANWLAVFFLMLAARAVFTALLFSINVYETEGTLWKAPLPGAGGDFIALVLYELGALSLANTPLGRKIAAAPFVGCAAITTAATVWLIITGCTDLGKIFGLLIVGFISPMAAVGFGAIALTILETDMREPIAAPQPTTLAHSKFSESLRSRVTDTEI